MKLTLLFLTVLVLFFINGLTLDGSEFTESRDEISFKRDIKPIFKNRCTQCHNNNALLDISDYDIAYDSRYEIKSKVSSRKMPYFGGMIESERDLIIQWVDRGAKK